MATIFDAPGYLQAKTNLYNSNFDTNYTDAEMKDIINDAGFTLQEHYLAFGQQELADAGVEFDPSVPFDEEAYLEAKTDLYNSNFDTDYTPAEMQDLINDAGMTVYEHYQDFGKAELADAGIVFPAGDGNGNNNGGIPGDTINLGEQSTVVDGTNADDTFNAHLGIGNNTILDSSFTLNGHGGTDTLNANLNGTGTANAPYLNSVENVNLTAMGPAISVDEGGNGVNSTDVFNAQHVTGTYDYASVQSQNDLEITWVTTDGVNGGTGAMHFGMDHTGNADSNWSESNMTALFDQDDLTTEQHQEGYSFELMDQASYDATNGANPVGDFPMLGLQFTVEGVEDPYHITVTADDIAGLTSQQDVVDMLNEKLADTELAGTAQFALGGTFSDGDGRTSDSITLTVDGATVTSGQFDLNTASGAGNIFWDQGPLGNIVSPVTTNVDLTKVGLSGDGGYLQIGSMNKGANDNELHQAHTVNNTIDGIQQFNVTVHGTHDQTSSLSALLSTNNALETVNIDSADGAAGNWADLWIGNAHTGDAPGVHALKDVATVDASGFQGDLHINGAALTDADFGAKYDLYQSVNASTDDHDWDSGVTATNNWLDDDGNTLIQTNPGGAGQDVVYTGGDGNDVFNIAIGDDVALASHIGDDGVSLTVQGGDGNDVINVAASDTDANLNTGVWTLEGGAGDDTYTLGDGNNTIVFNEGVSTNALGDDTIVNWHYDNGDAVAEVQKMGLHDVTLAAGQKLQLNIDGHVVTYTNASQNAEGGDTLVGKLADPSNYNDPDGVLTDYSLGTDASGFGGANLLTFTQDGGTEHNIGSITATVNGQEIAAVTTTNGVADGVSDDAFQTGTEVDGNTVFDFSGYDFNNINIFDAGEIGSVADQANNWATVEGSGNIAFDGQYTYDSDAHNKAIINLIQQEDANGTATGTYDIEYYANDQVAFQDAVHLGSIDLGLADADALASVDAGAFVLAG